MLLVLVVVGILDFKNMFVNMTVEPQIVSLFYFEKHQKNYVHIGISIIYKIEAEHH